MSTSKAFNTYITNISNRYKGGNATEHTYRGDLQTLLEALVPDAMVTNEPTRIACGAPDYIITKRDIPVGYIEAKDLGADLKSKGYKEQFDRYRSALPNLIITNYLDFEVYKEGLLVATYTIGLIQGNKVIANTAQFDAFTSLIKDFTTQTGQTIKSSQKLAEMMAGKAKLLAEVIGNALESDEETAEDSTLKEQLKAFKDILIHDINATEFADIYAQTIAYGMFAARLHDPTLETFTRREAAELIPKSNPFLRKLFQHIAGFDLDNRIVWIVDALADIFRATDVAALLKNFGKSTQANDPIIHFYETFLSEYDPKLRKSRGVWYTPEPVVKFIVRAVDDILKTEFNLPDGLADRTKTKVKINVQGQAKKQDVEMHRVQILDPATGTGTFLAEVVKYIYNAKFEGQQGVWTKYVEDHLIPRLNGFELLMASYAMAHLKLDMLLTETGYKPTKNQRLKIYLTNSLEEHHPDTGSLFASWLSDEANEANRIKRDSPVMVIIGNPPYAVSSSNKSEWIQNLIADYKKDLNERKINLDDDYIKFIRFGQHFIDKNGEGVLAYISNNSFIDGLTHRQMRKHLLESFDKIYILDLHGNANKKEISPDGSSDQNVFDIQQGVSINIFIKNRNKNKELYHFDLLGKREFKYDYLLNNSLDSIEWSSVLKDKDNCFFTSKNVDSQEEYLGYFSTVNIFSLYNSGIQTKRDSVNIHFNIDDAKATLKDFSILSAQEIKRKYFLPDDGRDWTIELAKKDIQGDLIIHKEQYRPFDYRYSYYTGKSKGIVAYPRQIVSKHIIEKDNISICLMRQFFQDADFSHVLISEKMIDERTMYSNRGGTYIFPLYLYPDNSGGLGIQESGRTPNLNKEIVAQIAKKLKLPFVAEKEKGEASFAPIDVLDYIYAVLHSPSYREKYKEFLKIDFPRVPYPKNAASFWQLVALGGQLRKLHLLEGIGKLITQYPIDGDNSVDKPLFKTSPFGGSTSRSEGREDLGRVYINDDQYFDNVPQLAWEFYIGGYQPAQKWLKDRKGRTLSYDDIEHYQKIILALTETHKLMQEIDKLTKEL